MRSALSTDLYELTMMAGYRATGMTGLASFELFVRRLPEQRSFLVAAGLEQALEYLQDLRFTREEIDFLRSVPNLQGAPQDFFDEYLPAFRFTGEVWAVDEGTPVFAQEPLLRVTAPLPEAQLVETALLAILTFQTSIASKAARILEVADGRLVVEFGARRAHGLDAALLAARAAYVAGCEGTSFVEAGRRFGIPLSGTMAHSWVLAFPDEMEAFKRYADLFGERAVFLLDTYDAVRAAERIASEGLRSVAVRLDSGDVIRLSREVRRILDAAGMSSTKIFVTGDLDEHRIASFLAAGAPVDGFGVGTALSTSSDAPALGGIYKLVELDRDGVAVGVMKLSPDKQTRPGRKQVWRRMEAGHAIGDLVSLHDEAGPPGGSPLLSCVMRDGRRLAAPPALKDLRSRCRTAVGRLPPDVRRLEDPAAYPVDYSAALTDLGTQQAGSARRHAR